MENSPTPTRAVIVPASAGSGKTYRIAHEYIYDVLRNHDSGAGVARFDRNFYKRILAVTFTNKATEEMKSRILKEIHLLAPIFSTPTASSATPHTFRILWDLCSSIMALAPSAGCAHRARRATTSKI